MRPGPAESIRGVVATLATSILPELATPWAQAQLRYSMGLLDSIAAEWDSAADNLVRENNMLQRVCGVLGERVAMDYSDSLTAQLASVQEAAALPRPDSLRLSALSEFNNRLWTALQPVIEAVGATDDTQEWAALLKSELQPVLHAYIAVRQFRHSV